MSEPHPITASKSMAADHALLAHIQQVGIEAVPESSDRGRRTPSRIPIYAQTRGSVPPLIGAYTSQHALGLALGLFRAVAELDGR